MMKLNDNKKYFAASAFTSCTPAVSLLETFVNAAKSATVGDEILLSPVRLNSERFQNLQQCGERIYSGAKSISWGCLAFSPNIHGSCNGSVNRTNRLIRMKNFSLRGFLRENHGANQHTNHTSQKGAIARQK
jgi:hypothetical protein